MDRGPQASEETHATRGQSAGLMSRQVVQHRPRTARRWRQLHPSF